MAASDSGDDVDAHPLLMAYLLKRGREQGRKRGTLKETFYLRQILMLTRYNERFHDTWIQTGSGGG